MIGYGILDWFVVPVLVWEPYLPPVAQWGLPPVLIAVGVGSNVLPARRVARIIPADVLREYEGE